MKHLPTKEKREWFEGFFYPIVDLDNGIPDDPQQRAENCMKYFVKPLLQQQKKEISGKLPKKKKTCGCEDDEFGYHTKECTLYEYGWNDCLDQIKSIIDRV